MPVNGKKSGFLHSKVALVADPFYPDGPHSAAAILRWFFPTQTVPDTEAIRRGLDQVTKATEEEEPKYKIENWSEMKFPSSLR